MIVKELKLWLLQSLLLIVISDTINGQFSTGTAGQNQNCGVYGCGSCCLNLAPLNLLETTLPFTFENQPYYIAFLPLSPGIDQLDNICVTLRPLPDNTYVNTLSMVFADGTNIIQTSLDDQSDDGICFNGSPQCQYIDINFAQVQDERNGCQQVFIYYRCVLNGACPTFVPALGTTYQRRPVPQQCRPRILEEIENAGLPQSNYYFLPMRLPPRCIFTSACTITSRVEQFQQALGFGDVIKYPTCAK